MIAVVGSPTCMAESNALANGDAGGLAAGIALAAAAIGAEVQLIGRIGEDPAGDAVLLALARGGVGHIALLRDPGHATRLEAPAREEEDPAASESIAALIAREPSTDLGPGDTGGAPTPSAAGLALEAADISLGLRYVQDFRVLVAADPLNQASAAVVLEAATFTDATLIVISPHGRAVPATLPDALVLEAPGSDPEGAFVALVARLAVAVDRGADAAAAFGSAIADSGWERAAS